MKKSDFVVSTFRDKKGEKFIEFMVKPLKHGPFKAHNCSLSFLKSVSHLVTFLIFVSVKILEHFVRFLRDVTVRKNSLIFTENGSFGYR